MTEVLGRNIIDITPAQATQAQAEKMMARLKLGASWSGSFEVRHRSGRSLPIHVTNSPLRNERDELIGIIGISTDMTEPEKNRQGPAPVGHGLPGDRRGDHGAEHG